MACTMIDEDAPSSSSRSTRMAAPPPPAMVLSVAVPGCPSGKGFGRKIISYLSYFLYYDFDAFNAKQTRVRALANTHTHTHRQKEIAIERERIRKRGRETRRRHRLNLHIAQSIKTLKTNKNMYTYFSVYIHT